MAQVAAGTTADRPFARTIYTIAAKRFTGELVLDYEGRPYRVGWSEGLIVAAESSSPSDSIGRVALSAGLVTPAQLSDSLRAMSSGGKSQLEALCHVADLGAEQCKQLASHAMTQRALRIFALANANFILDNQLSLEPAPELAPLDPRWVIYRGLLTHYDVARLERELAAVGARRLTLSPDATASLRHFGFRSSDKPHLAKLRDQPASVAEMMARTPAAEQVAVLAQAYALLSCDCLTVGEAAPAPAPARPEPPPARPVETPKPPPARPVETPKPPPARSIEPAQPAPARPPAPAPAPGKMIRPTAPAAARPAKPASSKNSATVEETRRMIGVKLGELDAGANHFEFLGVAAAATPAEVQKAYFALARQLHPDRLQALAITDAGGDAQRLFASINHAFDVVSSPGKRAEYERLLDDDGNEASDQDVEAMAMRIFGAEEQFQRGLMALRRNHHSEAVAAFAEAVALNPEEGEHHALLAWAKWCAAADKDAVGKEVRKGLRQAIRISPKCVSAYFYRGQMAKQQGKRETAIDCFEKVLALQKDHKEAELELRLLTRRQSESEDKRSTLLNRLRRK